MRRSFVHLVLSSVFVFFLLGFVALVIYGRNLSWTDKRARTDSVFLFHEILDDTAPNERATKLANLSTHTDIPLTLVSPQQVEKKMGRELRPGETAPFRAAYDSEWYFLAFNDGSGALAAGPVHPGRPTGVIPIGLFIGVALLPLGAALIAFRLERGISKVERASQNLASGDLTTRIDNAHGPARELAANFNDMAERIERLVRSRDELVQAVSHELGSPLSRLRFHLELLESEPKNQQAQRVAAISRDLDALDELVGELLSYVQSDELTIEHQEFAARDSLTDLAELAKLEASPTRNIDVSLSADESVTIFADPKLFQRAVENLLRNAVRHAATGVQIILTASASDVQVAVHDDGPGIPEELRESVLTPFFRVESDRGRDTGGTGLGLAIVSRIMERHGGRVLLDDSPLGGARVVTVWPKRPTLA